MTPKQSVLKKYPNAELVRDGWDERAGPSGAYDFAIYNGEVLLSADGVNPTHAWKLAWERLAL